MKKLLLVLVNVLLFASVNAQGGVFLGPRAGGGWQAMRNANWVNPEGADNMVFEEGVPGLFYGFEIGYNMWNYNFGITSGAIIRNYNYALNVNYQTPGVQHAEFKINNIEIPLMIRFRDPGNKRTKMVSNGGPYFEMGAQMQLTQSVMVEHYIDPNFAAKVTEDLTQYYEKSTLGAIVGFGFSMMSFDRFQLNHGLRFTYTFTDFLLDKDYEFFQAGGNFPGWSEEYKPTKLMSITYMMSMNFKLYSNKGGRR